MAKPKRDIYDKYIDDMFKPPDTKPKRNGKNKKQNKPKRDIYDDFCNDLFRDVQNVYGADRDIYGPDWILWENSYKKSKHDDSPNIIKSLFLLAKSAYQRSKKIPTDHDEIIRRANLIKKEKARETKISGPVDHQKKKS